MVSRTFAFPALGGVRLGAGRLESTSMVCSHDEAAPYDVHIPSSASVGESDRAGQAAAEAAAGIWRGIGLLVRVIMGEGHGRQPNLDSARLAGELAWQASRQTLP